MKRKWLTKTFIMISKRKKCDLYGLYKHVIVKSVLIRFTFYIHMVSDDYILLNWGRLFIKLPGLSAHVGLRGGGGGLKLAYSYGTHFNYQPGL